MKYKTISVEQIESIVRITLNRPEMLNPLDIIAGEEISIAIDGLQKMSGIRALLITGTGRAFSAGGDIRGMLDSVETGTPGKFMDDLTQLLYGIGLKLRKLPFPVVAAVNGLAVGAGMNLALCCDYIIASDKASFMQSFSKLALIPGFGGTHLLINQTTWQKACEIAFLGEPVSATEMKELGFVNKIVPHDELENEALKLTEKLAKGPTLTFARTKELFLKAMNSSFEGHLDYERKVQISSAETADYAEGVKALNKKIEPDFKGQ